MEKKGELLRLLRLLEKKLDKDKQSSEDEPIPVLVLFTSSPEHRYMYA